MSIAKWVGRCYLSEAGKVWHSVEGSMVLVSHCWIEGKCCMNS